MFFIKISFLYGVKWDSSTHLNQLNLFYNYLYGIFDEKQVYKTNVPVVCTLLTSKNAFATIKWKNFLRFLLEIRKEG